jgi:hypothetical protein
MYPVYFILLWGIMMVELFVRTKTISRNLSDIHHTNPETRIHAYIGLSTIRIGFGIIFGTTGLFSNPETITDWWYWIAMMVFSNICTIMARGYLRESPIVSVFTSKIVSKFSRLGFVF